MNRIFLFCVFVSFLLIVGCSDTELNNLNPELTYETLNASANEQNETTYPTIYNSIVDNYKTSKIENNELNIYTTNNKIVTYSISRSDITLQEINYCLHNEVFTWMGLPYSTIACYKDSNMVFRVWMLNSRNAPSVKYPNISNKTPDITNMTQDILADIGFDSSSINKITDGSQISEDDKYLVSCMEDPGKYPTMPMFEAKREFCIRNK
jgi:hypothetical protein